MDLKKVVYVSLAGLMLGGVPLTSGTMIVSANETPSITQNVVDFNSIKPTQNQLQSIGLSEQKINLYLYSNNSDLYIKDGLLFDKNGLRLDSESSEYGKLSWAAKAIRKGYNKLPKSVKNLINRYTKIEFILSFVEHCTGSVENAIYKACKYVRMPDWAAWTVSKALTLVM